MTICLPIYRQVAIDDYQMFPGDEDISGLSHTFSPGLHLVAGVNGLGKSTLILALYHGVVGPASIRNDEYGVPRPDVVPHRLTDRFRKRVADGARSALLTLRFSLGSDEFSLQVTLQVRAISASCTCRSFSIEHRSGSAWNDSIVNPSGRFPAPSNRWPSPS